MWELHLNNVLMPFSPLGEDLSGVQMAYHAGSPFIRMDSSVLLLEVQFLRRFGLLGSMLGIR